jgi:hypothetical protein
MTVISMVQFDQINQIHGDIASEAGAPERTDASRDRMHSEQQITFLDAQYFN